MIPLPSPSSSSNILFLIKIFFPKNSELNINKGIIDNFSDKGFFILHKTPISSVDPLFSIMNILSNICSLLLYFP